MGAERCSDVGEARDSQADVVAFLSDSKTHGGAKVTCYETHAARVFVAGDRAYKLKRAVRYPYLDFSTPELRRAASEHELELNRRATPELYLEVRPLIRDEAGDIAWGVASVDQKEIVDWVLVMRAFDQHGLLEAVARRGELDAEMARQLTDAVMAQHRVAPVVRPPMPHRGGADGIAITVAENRQDFEARPDIFPPDLHAALDRDTAAAIEARRDLLERRMALGYVRHCHGDLHLRNICLIDGRPRLFDALEFDDAIASNDRLYDLAFLLMDMEQLGLGEQANLVFNRYVQTMDEEAALGALPLFLSIRAAIRAKVASTVEATRADPARKAHDREEARAYFASARAYLHPPAPCLVALGGLSGSGKSSAARALAPSIGPAPGALLLRSDVLRKRLFGIEETESLPETAYRPEINQRVYQSMRERAASALGAGHAVVLDAVHARPEEREAAEALAGELPFLGLWLDAPPDAMIARVEARQGDASDADGAVVRQQIDYEIGAITWHRIDAARDLESVVAEAREILRSKLPEAIRAPAP